MAPKFIFCLLTILLVTVDCFAAPGPPPPQGPPGPPGFPIDGNIFYLIFAAAFLGFYKMHKQIRKQLPDVK